MSILTHMNVKTTTSRTGNKTLALLTAAIILIGSSPAQAQNVITPAQGGSVGEAKRETRQQVNNQQEKNQNREIQSEAVKTLIKRATRLCKPVEEAETEKDKLYSTLLDLETLEGDNREYARKLLEEFANQGGTICINTAMSKAIHQNNGEYGVTHPITTTNNQNNGQRPAVAAAQFYRINANDTKAPVLEISTFVSSYAASEDFKGEDPASCLMAPALIPLVNRDQDPRSFESGVVTTFFAIDAETCIGQDSKGPVWASLNTNQVIEPAFRVASKSSNYIITSENKPVKVLNISE